MTWGEPLTPEWRRNRPLILKRANYICELGWKGCTRTATEADHIVNRDSWPFDKPGRDDVTNGQALCHSCHVKKTSYEQQRKRRKNKEVLKHRWTRIKHPGLK
ncbi:HNH endonuclease [Gordonia phage WilliamBoone]|nr:HNH endonuclease [Gordonia phage WilliamBoone]